MKPANIIIITGLSGSGKSTALAALEDAGYFCVDNLPVELLPKLLELPVEPPGKMAGLGLVMDLRDKRFPEKYEAVLDGLRQAGYRLEILFLEADDKTLLQRYSATRRHHPLARGRAITAGLQSEKKLLQPLRAAADRIIDTSDYTVHELKAHLQDIAAKGKARAPMQINVLAFGFKYGIPLDADLVVDVRFLANPYFVAELKALDGTDERIRAFVLGDDETRRFLNKYKELLDYLIPLYEREGKAYLTIAVGCTGGRHRSVVIAGELYRHIAQGGRQVAEFHRDIGRG